MLQTTTGHTLPCEMTAVEFCLQYGITRVLHGFIRPPEIPLGYGYQIQAGAKEVSRHLGGYLTSFHFSEGLRRETQAGP